MGGLNSEVTEGTTDVFLEGAMFNPVNIRRTSKALGLSTDASFRFERGGDINMCPQAVDRAASLISSLTLGKVAPGLIDVCPRPFRAKAIPFSPPRCNAFLGTNYTEAEMKRVLGDLGFTLKRNSQKGATGFKAEVPSWRPDIFGESDLFEEVVRVLDFENLPATLPKAPRAASPPPPQFRLRERLRTFMAGRGFQELMSYSFLNRNFADKLELTGVHPLRQGIRALINPLSEEQGVLRTTLVPQLLASARLNQYHGQWDLRLFELGAVFHQKGGGDLPPEEVQTFAALLAGDPDQALWNEEKRPVDFFDLKGVLEALAAGFLEEWEYIPNLDSPFLDPGESATIKRKGQPIGYVGLLSGAVSKNFGLKKKGGPVYVFEIQIESLPAETVPEFVPFSNYPGVHRDLAILVDAGISARDVIECMKASSDSTLLGISVFDVYEGDKLPSGTKSLAFRLFFQDRERTLTEELVGGYFKGMLEELSKKFGARLRA
jgi:phenylalanyl-tRNA synthetase beta chain